MNFQIVIGAIDPGFNLRFEEIDRTRDRQHNDEGEREDPCVKMPAPDGPIIRQPVRSGGIGKFAHGSLYLLEVFIFWTRS